MQVNLYSGFSKRINSTKLPNTTATVKNGTLRNPCSVTSPEIEFKTMGQTCPANFCYAYIPSFQRYYFITDWVAEGALWVCRMNEDCLASWRTEIGNTTAYIERSASQYDGKVIDNLYPCDVDYTLVKTDLACAWNGVAPSGGCFVVGIICNASTYYNSSLAGGSVTYYVLTPANLRSLIHYLYSGTFLEDNGFPVNQTLLQQLSNEVAKAFVNPSQYIVSCMWFPFPVASFGSGQDRDIQVGYYDLGQNHGVGKYVDSVVFTSTVTSSLPIPDHPSAQTRGEYLNYTPYSNHTVIVQPFGSFNIDTAFLKYGKYLYCPVSVDPITGKAIMRVHVRGTPSPDSLLSPVMCELSSMIGVPIQLSQVTSDFLGASTDLIKGGAIIANGLSRTPTSSETGIVPYGSVKPPIGFGSGDMALMLALPSIGSAIKDIAGSVQSVGVNGSYLLTSPTLSPCITSIFKNPVKENNSECGRPLCDTKVINTLSGFIKCGEVTVNYPCYDAEKVTIHNHLVGGFFWE